MTVKRVLFACPRFHAARNWTDYLAGLPGVDVVGWAETPIEVLLQATAGQVHFVVLDLPEDRSDPGLSSHLLEELPGSKVLAVSRDGSEAVLYQRDVVRTPLGGREWSDPQQLVRLME